MVTAWAQKRTREWGYDDGRNPLTGHSTQLRRQWFTMATLETAGVFCPLPYAPILPFAQALIDRAPQNLLWGSDWPHTSHDGAMPNDGDLLDLLAQWAPDATVRDAILRTNPARLYGFDIPEEQSR